MDCKSYLINKPDKPLYLTFKERPKACWSNWQIVVAHIQRTFESMLKKLIKSQRQRIDEYLWFRHFPFLYISIHIIYFLYSECSTCNDSLCIERPPLYVFLMMPWIYGEACMVYLNIKFTAMFTFLII